MNRIKIHISSNLNTYFDQKNMKMIVYDGQTQLPGFHHRVTQKRPNQKLVEAKSSNLMGVFGTKAEMSLGLRLRVYYHRVTQNGQTRNWLEANHPT